MRVCSQQENGKCKESTLSTVWWFVCSFSSMTTSNTSGIGFLIIILPLGFFIVAVVHQFLSHSIYTCHTLRARTFSSIYNLACLEWVISLAKGNGLRECSGGSASLSRIFVRPANGSLTDAIFKHVIPGDPICTHNAFHCCFIRYAAHCHMVQKTTIEMSILPFVIYMERLAHSRFVFS